MKIKIKFEVLRKKISLLENKLKEKVMDLKPRTILKNSLFEKRKDEKFLLLEEKYLLRRLIAK